MLNRGRRAVFTEYNREKEIQFTSTGEKILAHPEVIESIRHRRKGMPIVLHVMPTERCNLRCVFCSVSHRNEREDLPFGLMVDVMKELQRRGLKALILSGGGDPTLYPRINDLLHTAYEMGLDVGMITNGVALEQKVGLSLIRQLKWLRISINTLDYLKDFALPDLADTPITLGFSYIWNPLSQVGWPRVLEKVKAVERHMPVNYVRLLPDCNLPSDELESAHRFLNKTARDLGTPFFHQYKMHQTPDECHLGRVHPVLYTDRMIYPCDSLVLNSPPDDKKFHQDYALCHAEEIGDFFDRPINGSLVDTQLLCHHCVFHRQNRLLMDVLYDVDEPEVRSKSDFLHANFV